VLRVRRVDFFCAVGAFEVKILCVREIMKSVSWGRKKTKKTKKLLSCCDDDFFFGVCDE
jgi:hypothetical protein